MLNGAQLGRVTVVTTTDGDHPPEYYAQRIVDRLIVIGEHAPEPIKAQALAYRQHMLATVLDGLKRAIESDRLYRK
jgi:hypothetical protein